MPWPGPLNLSLNLGLFQAYFKVKLSPLNMLKCTTTETVKNAVAWILKFKLKFRLNLGLLQAYFRLKLSPPKYARVHDHRGGQECRDLDP